MRVTNSMMVRNMLDNLQNNLDNLSDLNQKLGSGKVFQKPSDGPIEVSDSLNYKSILNRNSQYQRNLSQADNWLSASENALNSATDVIQRSRELTIYAATDSLTAADREQIAAEFKELRNEMIDISETKLGDNYIFSGQNLKEKPFTVIENPDFELEYQGDNRGITRQLNDGVQMKINLSGERVFQDDIELLNDIYQELSNEEAGADEIGEYIADVEVSLNDFTKLRSELGAKTKRITMTESRLEAEELQMRKLQSQNEDADLAEVITELMMQESVYNASLASGSRIMQQSLVDFIR